MEIPSINLTEAKKIFSVLNRKHLSKLQAAGWNDPWADLFSEI